VQTIAIFSSGSRSYPRLPSGEPLRIVSVAGSWTIDLSQLPPTQEQIKLSVFAALGSVVVLVPRGTVVLDAITTLVGSANLPRESSGEAPPLTLRLGGFTFLGSVTVRAVG
jgi:hypothetical protein